MPVPFDHTHIGTVRHHAHVAKWENHRTPDDGEPDRIDTAIVWHEADGSVVTDPQRFDYLEDLHKQQHPELYR